MSPKNLSVMFGSLSVSAFLFCSNFLSLSIIGCIVSLFCCMSSCVVSIFCLNTFLRCLWCL